MYLTYRKNQRTTELVSKESFMFRSPMAKSSIENSRSLSRMWDGLMGKGVLGLCLRIRYENPLPKNSKQKRNALCAETSLWKLYDARMPQLQRKLGQQKTPPCRDCGCLLPKTRIQSVRKFRPLLTISIQNPKVKVDCQRQTHKDHACPREKEI